MVKNVLPLVTFFIFFQSISVHATSVGKKINDLFVDNPQSESVTLSNGLLLQLPVHYRQIAAIVSIGTVDLKKAQASMRPMGLFPVPLTAKSGLAIVYVVEHSDNTIGKYREFVTLIAATSNSKQAAITLESKLGAYKKLLGAFFPALRDSEARKNKDFVFYVPFISVNSEDALLAGREVWNLPKKMAYFELNFEGNRNFASVKAANCSIEIQQNDRRSQIKVPLYMDFNLVGFWNQNYSQIVRAPMLAKGTAYVSLFDEKKGDSINIDRTSECGQWFTNVEFKPKAWQYVPRSGAILFNKNTEVKVPEGHDFITTGVDTEASSEQFIKQLSEHTE